MGRAARIAVVVAGYAAAIGAAAIAAWAYNWRVAAFPYDTSGGMYAGGEMMCSLAAFLCVALVPTLLALWFLRGNEKFWNVVAVASLAFAVVGLLAVRETLGWECRTTFEDGLEKASAWYRDNEQWWRPPMWMRHIPIVTASGRREMH